MIYAVFTTSAGWMGVRGSEKGLTYVALPRPDKDGVLKELGVTDDGDTAAFADFIGRCQAYFEGEPVEFPDDVDISSGTPFQQRAWEACRRIPRGTTISYRDLAAEAGSPGGARAAGAAMARNPVPIVVPCHRVVGSDGSLHGFGGGLPLKQLMLEMEKER